MNVTAILYDIHGNLTALEAVLSDARTAGAEQFILGGDYALFGPQPIETLETLRALPEPAAWIRGNVDRWVAFPPQAGEEELLQRAITDCRDALGAAAAAELGELPEQHVDGESRFCHASPPSDLRSFLPRPAEDEDELLADVPQRRVVFGHTHLQFRRRRADGIELLNPGSVGMPFDGDPRAAYALATSAADRFELRRVAYDHERAAATVPERFGEVDWALRSERRIRCARP